MLLGKEAVDRLVMSSVAVFGIGGVGGFVVEALARSGVGTIAVIDKDVVDITNINRQIIATHNTIGVAKVQLAKNRILEINPNANVIDINCFYGADTVDSIDLSQFSYIVDAVDTISAKLLLVQQAKSNNIPIISCMGMGNKLDPTAIEIADIYKTSVCPLAKVMRKELRVRGIDSLTVVYSKEVPMVPFVEEGVNCEHSTSVRRQTPGSVAFVPSVAGLIIASRVVRDLGDV